MSKKLNEWLDEFVENGADPSDVIAWPESAGGSSEAGVNMIVTGGWYKLGVDELAKVIATIEQEHTESRIDYGLYIYGRGGSGIEFVRGNPITLDYTPGILSVETPAGDVLDFSHVASTMSESLIENKENIESVSFELYQGYYFGFIEDSGNNFYPIDITKVFIPTEAPEPQQEL